jgi:hypothetical protein
MSMPHQVEPPRGRRVSKLWWLLPVTVVVGVTLGGGAQLLASAGNPPLHRPVRVVSDPQDLARSVPETPVATVTTEEPVTTEPPAPVRPRDFAVAISVVEKECFGSAGCVLTYRVSPRHIGAAPLPLDGVALTVVFRVLGGGDEQIDSFTVLDGTIEAPEEKTVQTPSSAARLTARVTQVL